MDKVCWSELSAIRLTEHLEPSNKDAEALMDISIEPENAYLSTAPRLDSKLC